MNANDIRARLEECERMNARPAWSGIRAGRDTFRFCNQCGIGCRVSDGAPASRPAVNRTMPAGHILLCHGCRYQNYVNSARGVFTPARDDARPVLTFDQWIDAGMPNARQAAAILAGWRTHVTPGAGEDARALALQTAGAYVNGERPAIAYWLGAGAGEDGARYAYVECLDILDTLPPGAIYASYPDVRALANYLAGILERAGEH